MRRGVMYTKPGFVTSTYYVTWRRMFVWLLLTTSEVIADGEEPDPMLGETDDFSFGYIHVSAA